VGGGLVLHSARERIRPLLPRRAWQGANRIVFSGIGLALRGDAVHCPCCGRSYRRFVEYPTLYCPGCGSYARQRLLCLYLDANPDLVSGDVLQVGPARSILQRYKPRARSWLAIDLDPEHPLADRTMDVTALSLRDATFDLILCSHVLDLVPEHDVAVAELHRVTRPGGRLLVQGPRRFNGLPDSYARRLGQSGFDVVPLFLDEQGDPLACRRLGLDPRDPIFACLRPA
jgi:SAM-dependent methyltransferase